MGAPSLLSTHHMNQQIQNTTQHAQMLDSLKQLFEMNMEM
jgi:hypothetical protein